MFGSTQGRISGARLPSSVLVGLAVTVALCAPTSAQNCPPPTMASGGQCVLEGDVVIAATFSTPPATASRN